MDYLIPQLWFNGMAMWPLLGIAALTLVALIKGADWLVDGASGCAYRLGIPKIIVGATVVSLGTTSPEAAVSVMAAWAGNPGLALGNAVGSIIADTGLIFGLGCLITVLPVDPFVLRRQGWVQFGSAVLLAALCYAAFAQHGAAAELGRWVGVLMLVLLVGYMLISIRWSRQHAAHEPFLLPDDVTEISPLVGETAAQAKKQSILWLLGLIVVGLTVVIFASHVLICSVTVVAKDHWHIPEVVISSTLVAFGTSLPELATAVAALRKGHKDLLIGNIIGADILNVLFVIGASAVGAWAAGETLPIVDPTAKVPLIFLYLHLPAMLIILLLFRLFITRAIAVGHFSRWMGAPLVLLYVVFVVVNFVIS